MKKILVLTALALSVTAAAYAGTDTITLSTTNTGLSVYGDKAATALITSPLIGKTSSGVGIGMATNPTGGYGLVTQHKSGTKAFGSAYDSTSIYTKDVATVGTPVTVTITTGSSTFDSTWTTL